MASKKTTQEASGAPIQSNDLFRIARSADNKKLTSAEIFTENHTSAEFTAKVLASELIPGRYYRVNGVSPTSPTLYFATDVDKYSSVGIGENDMNWKEPGSILNTRFAKIDSYFNTIIRPDVNTSNYPINSNYFVGNTIAYNGGDTVINNGAATIENCYFNNSEINGSYDDKYYDSTFVDSTVNILANPGGTVLKIKNSTLINCIISFDETDGSSEILIENCYFNNCSVIVKNGVTIKNLSIFGSTDISNSIQTSYIFDGSFQSKIFNDYSGIIFGTENYGGYSTVKAKLSWDNSTLNGYWIDAINETIYIPPQCPVGEFYIEPKTDQQNAVIDISALDATGGNPTRHPYKFMWLSNSQNNEIDFIAQTLRANMSVAYNFLKPHGFSSQSTKLKRTDSWIQIRQVYDDVFFDYSNRIEFGLHYD